MLPDGLDELSRDCLSRVGDEYVRSSEVVGDDDGYAALVRLTQDFEQRYPLVEGRGNFGSVDGDPPADAIYTEVRRSPLGRALERFPNLLVNGSATIPPHNLGEVAAAVLAVLDDPAIDVDGLMRLLPGPDFPTGGVVADAAAIRGAYATGSGSLRLRGRALLEDRRIVVTELPFGVEKGGDDGIIRAIVEGVVDGTLRGVDDIQDHSDRQGLRLLILLAPDVDGLDVLQRLFASTALERTFTVDLARFTLRTLIDAFLSGRDPEAVRRELPELASRHGDARRTLIR